MPKTFQDSSPAGGRTQTDRKSTRLNSSHSQISYAVFCLKKKKQNTVRNGCTSTRQDRQAIPRLVPRSNFCVLSLHLLDRAHPVASPDPPVAGRTSTEATT